MSNKTISSQSDTDKGNSLASSSVFVALGVSSVIMISLIVIFRWNRKNLPAANIDDTRVDIVIRMAQQVLN